MKINSPVAPDRLYSGRELRMTAPEGIYSQRRSYNATKHWVVLFKENNPALPRTIFTIYNDQLVAVAKDGLNDYTEFSRLPNAHLRAQVATS